MKKLYYKVLEIKEQCDHTVDDIDNIVKSRIQTLNEEYKTRYDRKITQGKYISKEYKAFVTYTGKDADKYENLLNECIIHTTNIANFIDGKTKRPQNVTKDFFAIYCECEGYNDFVVKYKNIEVIQSISTPLDGNSTFEIPKAIIIDEVSVKNNNIHDPSMLEFYKRQKCQIDGVFQKFDMILSDYGKILQDFKYQNSRLSAMLLEKREDEKILINSGYTKYRILLPDMTFKIKDSHQYLITEMAHSFTTFFTEINGINLNFEVRSKTKHNITLFYFTDENIDKEEFTQMLEIFSKRFLEFTNYKNEL